MRIENYEVTRDGRVISKNFAKQKYVRELKPQMIGNYFGVSIDRKWIHIHRLVAIIHLPNPENKPQVNHIDGNKLNNNVNNLEWVTRSENMLHAYRELGIEGNKSNLGNLYGNSFGARPVFQKSINGELIKMFDCVRRAWHETGVSETNISNCLHGRCKTAGGFKWEYA